ncbi:MAG: PAS domain S-box protein [Vicingus serpentipes]|nr:PAS domain S-box protein [Vicingus serpentipes]
MDYSKKSKKELIEEIKKLENSIFKKAVEKLKLSEKSYKDLFDKSNNLLYIQSEEGFLLDINKTALKKYGFKKADVIGKKTTFLAAPNKNNFKEIFEKNTLAWEGKEQVYEFFAKKKSGVIFPKEVIVRKGVYFGKNVLISTAVDITDRKKLAKEKIRTLIAEESNKLLQKEIKQRKQARKELIESQKYNRSIISSSLDIICASNKKGEIIEFNTAAERAFGYKEKEVLQKKVKLIYAFEEEYIKVSKNLKEKGTFTGEIINKRKNGETFLSFLSASFLYSEEGEIIGTMGVSRDITELKEAEKQLIESEEKYRHLFENSSDLIQGVNDKGEIEYINNTWKKTMGYTTKEIINKNIFDFIHPESIEHCKNIFKGFFNKKADGKYIKTSFALKNKKGQKIILEGDISCKYNGDNFSTKGILRNVTEEKLTEQELKNSLQEKEVLLKEVHHRVKNNLQVISSILNLQSSYVEDKKTLDILRESQNRIKSMSFIHESLYQTSDFSKINFSQYIDSLSKNLVHSYVIHDDLVELKVNAKEVFLNLDLSIPCGLIVNELVSNALKYAFTEGVKGVINIELFIKEENVNLIIKDNGVGLPTEIDFQNTETLGLQLVMSLIEQINGTIKLLKEKKGTGYIITFKKEQ